MNDKEIFDQYLASKSERDKNVSLWQEISKYVGISVDPQYDKSRSSEVSAKDTFVDDPTSAICVNQFGDYMLGIMWGTGDKVFNVVPSEHVIQRSPVEAVDKWFRFITSRSLYHANHPDAGLNSALKPYAYDQASFGNSGVGAFDNPEFKGGASHNAFIFRNYGIDNTSFEEGLNGTPEKVFVDVRWKLNRIIKEHCTEDGKISDALINKLPRNLKDAYARKEFTKEFALVHGVFPRDDYNPKLLGKRGRKYRGVWFLNDGSDNKIYREEAYSTKPICMARQIRVRGENYGRSSGTLLLSTIKSVNFMVGTVMEILEKMGNPSLGIMNNAIFGDSVLDTSPNALTVFNSSTMGDSKNPVFPLYDVGNPEGIIKILIPYLNEKITTAFKVDALLDFNSAKDMTATESLQRYAIRGKSLSGLLVQQKTELLYPLVMRIVTRLYEIGEFGVNPAAKQQVTALRAIGRDDMVIPDAVIDCINKGLPWFDLKFNNELEKLTRTESIEGLLKVIQVVGAIAPMYPAIVEAIDWYKLLEDINSNLDPNNQILIGAKEFKDLITQRANDQRQLLAIQAAQVGSQANKNAADANKANKEAVAA